MIPFLPKVCEIFVCSYSELRSDAPRTGWNHADNLFQASQQKQTHIVTNTVSPMPLLLPLSSHPLQLCSVNFTMESSLLPSVSSKGPVWGRLLEPLRLNQHYLLFCQLTYSISSGLVTSVFKYYLVSHWSIKISFIPKVPLYDNTSLQSRLLKIYIQSLFKM